MFHMEVVDKDFTNLFSLKSSIAQDTKEAAVPSLAESTD